MIPLPPLQRVIPARWTFYLKVKAHNSVSRFKTQLVGKRYIQIEGVDFTEIYSLLSKHITLRLVVALRAANGWSRMPLDIKTAFQIAPLNFDVYIQQSCDYVQAKKESHVYLLTNALYGLKQAARLRYQMLDECLGSIGLQRTFADVLLTTIYSRDTIIIILI